MSGKCSHSNKTPVGASLLAMTPAHPASPQTDPPLSRAGSLPQVLAQVIGVTHLAWIFHFPPP
ncbi:hypothetical protein CF597_26245 [Pseudomonas sp. PSB1]|nr:hypothetical protein [Pseudomonas sp. PSB1]